jgi:hypothetical protein
MDATRHPARDMSDLVRNLGDEPLWRLVCYGEALRAVMDHVGERFLPEPADAVLTLLDTAFDHLSDVRVDFPPEEFTLLVLSRLLATCKDSREARAFQRGAVRYITCAAPSLPPDYDTVVEDARHLMRGYADRTVLREAVDRERARQDARDAS